MHLFFSVGEPSGDQHAAELIKQLRALRPGVEASGFGGPLMEQAGFRCQFRLTDLAVMGFFRVVPMLAQFYRLVQQAGRILEQERPDAVVLVDFPGFNWWVARKAKRLGIPVVYYLPPQLWAWGAWRIKRVRRLIDHLLCGLSFEQQWYEQRGVAAKFVGHPFFDEIAARELQKDFLESVAEKRIVGLLPGSRNQEVEQNWPVLLEAARQIAESHPNVQFQVASFKAAHRDKCQAALQSDPAYAELPISFQVGKTSEIISVAECCVMVSGSVSLEMLARRTPAVVIYCTSFVTSILFRLLIRCKYASLPNLMVDRALFPEIFLMRDHMEIARRAAEQVNSWLESPESLEQVRDELRELHEAVGQTGASRRAAETILDVLASKQILRRAG